MSSWRSTMATRPVAAIADTAEPIAKPRSTARRFGTARGCGNAFSIRLRSSSGALYCTPASAIALLISR